MKKIQMPKIIFLLIYMFVFTFIIGCGRAHLRTIKEPMDVSNYNEIYVANTDISCREQTWEAKDLNAKYSQFAKDEIVNALKQRSKYTILENISSSPNSLIIETTIHIVYGSRALRYLVGFGAGSGSIVVNMKSKESSSNEIKLEMESRSKLSVGAFGGSMDEVIKNSIKKIVSQFIAKL